MEHVEDKCPTNNDGDTPLHEAARLGHLRFCQLINQQIPDNKHQRNNKGKTPLDLAKDNSQIDVVELFNKWENRKSNEKNKVQQISWTNMYYKLTKTVTDSSPFYISSVVLNYFGILNDKYCL